MCHKAGFLLLVISVLCFSSQLHSVSSIVADTVVTDSVQALSEVFDSSGVPNNDSGVDTLIEIPSPDKNAQEEKTGPVLIKRTYDYKSQVRLGISMMLFIAIIFGTAQSWNP
jgi:hypothetical protein